MATVTRKTFADKVQFSVARYVITKHIIISIMYSQCTCSTYTDARPTEQTHWLSFSIIHSLTHTRTHARTHARTHTRTRTHARTHARTLVHTRGHFGSYGGQDCPCSGPSGVSDRTGVLNDTYGSEVDFPIGLIGCRNPGSPLSSVRFLGNDVD